MDRISDIFASKKPLVVFTTAGYPDPARSEEGIAAASQQTAERGIGVDGILPVDLPLEERGELLEPCRKHGLHMIPLVSPLTPPDRIRRIVDGMTGFVYYINVAGVTGARRGLPADYPRLMEQVKSLTSLPVASGFGIADAETAKQAAAHADGVISGSGFVKALASGVKEAAEFVRTLADAIKP